MPLTLAKVRTPLTSIVKRIFLNRSPDPLRGGPEHLDKKYVKGDFDYLWNINELARFSLVAGYCQFLKQKGRILEVGCGESILNQRLSPNYSYFLGIDTSSHAIKRAVARGCPNAEFVAADAQTFVPEGRFDVIIFNDSLEYFHDPAGLVLRYEAYLDSTGLFIVCIFDGTLTRSASIWRSLETRYRLVDQARVFNSIRQSWRIAVLAPPVW